MEENEEKNEQENEQEIEQENEQSGSCEGPNSMYVKLIASDGHEFIIKREYALLSGTITAMLNGPGECGVNETNEINLRQIPSHILSQVCSFLTYKAKNRNIHINTSSFEIRPECVMDLLMAANFLDC